MRRLRINLSSAASVLVFVSLICLQAPSFAAQDQSIGSMRDTWSGKLFPDKAVRTHSSFDKLFPTRMIKASGKVKPIPKSDKPLQDIFFKSGDKPWDMVDYVTANQIVALIILKDGKMVFEHYDRGTTDKTHWASMSVAKSFTAALVGAALKDGAIKSLDDMVVTYLPELKGSAYEGVSLRHLLTMSSGLKWDETYVDPKSDRSRLLDLHVAQNKPGSVFEVMKTLTRAAPPGTVFKYNTGETILLGEVLRAATKKNLADYCSEKIWKPLGMEADAPWTLDSPNGHELAGTGVNAVPRDFARFGQFLLDGCVVDGKKLVPDWWMADATSPKELGNMTMFYGYQLWVVNPEIHGTVHTGAYEARGTFGQKIYIHPKEKLVVLILSARSKPEGPHRNPVSDYDFCGAVIEALR
ncbi:MAG: beta-lactamase family protein [Desulfovibrionaceae bacterium]|nr:beta-lactamase family protein [Desulfovibrionaceae bacterium]